MTTSYGLRVSAFSDVNLLAMSVTQPMVTYRYGTTTCGGIPNFNFFECYDILGMHHELTHSVDRKFLNPNKNSLSEPDPEWEKLNAPGFQYYGKDNFLQLPNVWHPYLVLCWLMGRHFSEKIELYLEL